MLIEAKSARPSRASMLGRFGHVILLAIAISLGSDAKLLGQTSAVRTTEDVNKPWTATTDLKRDNVNPTRIIESHSQNDNRTVDAQSIQIRGLDGYLVPYQDIEKETLQVDGTTVRTITRTFARDVNGAKTLFQVTEEEKNTQPSGDSAIVRITSNPDVNGKLQPVQREIVETKRIGTDAQETKTTVMLANINGGLAPAFKTDEVRKAGANDTIESQKATQLADGAGNWETSEVRQASTRREGVNRITEERVSRLDGERKLSEFSRSVSKESEGVSREKRKVVETYSVDVPGITRDGSLHPVERTTSTQRTSATGEQITEQQTEQPDPGDPQSGLHVSILINDTMRPGPSGEQSTLTIQMRDLNGAFELVSVDTTKSDKVPTIQVQQTP